MKSRVLKWTLGALCSMLMLAGAWSLAEAESGTVEVFSHGTSVLAASTDVALHSIKGNDVVFSKDAIERGMNLSNVHYITVASLPSVTEGELLLGSSRVAVGQVIAGGNLGYLSFHPATDAISHASFRFSVNGAGCEMTCSLWLLENGANATPSVALAPVLSLELRTFQSVAAYGTLSAYDPDGDPIRYEIVSYPQNGSLTLTDAQSGNYVYRPFSTYLGSDSFSYVARDRYGNYSASAKVSLTVDRLGTSVTYVDMVGSRGERAALNVTEKAVMSGSLVGDRYYFYPEQTVSRIDFLVMAMHAAGITDVPDCKQTVFADDGDIPATMKGYAAAAYRLGYITGTQRNGQLCLLPNETLTRAQAAVIIDRITEPGKAAVVPTFTDRSEIPVWAVDAIDSLNAVGILQSTDGQIAPTGCVTRVQAAQMLTALMQYLER